MASEGEAGKPMGEATLKRITGTKHITARFLRQEFFTFLPKFLIMMDTNHKPRFRSQDDGLWRRVKLIPFQRWFAPDERDYDLDRKLLAEAEGIAAWAVRGAVEWYARGLADPKLISDETREYRETSDSLAGFYPGVLAVAEGGELSGADAYNAYQSWCEEEGLTSKDVMARKTFYEAMGERGVTKRKGRLTGGYQGVILEGVRLATQSGISGEGIFDTK
jgi:putative DNA primase/helicase